MSDRKYLADALEGRIMGGLLCNGGYIHVPQEEAEQILAVLKERNPMSPEEFEIRLLEMFSSIWDCEIDHPVFQDTVGDLMGGVIQLYKKAVRRE